MKLHSVRLINSRLQVYGPCLTPSQVVDGVPQKPVPPVIPPQKPVRLPEAERKWMKNVDTNWEDIGEN